MPRCLSGCTFRSRSSTAGWRKAICRMSSSMMSFGAALGLDHLWLLGHRRIAVLHDDPDWSTTIDRLKGVRGALRRHGATLAKDLLIQAAHPGAAGEAALVELLRGARPPDRDSRAQQLRDARRHPCAASCGGTLSRGRFARRLRHLEPIFDPDLVALDDRAARGGHGGCGGATCCSRRSLARRCMGRRRCVRR